MDSGNRRSGELVEEINAFIDGKTVITFLRLPAELKLLAECYQKASRLPSLNAACCRLLETHPDLARIADSLYNEKDTSPKT